jgi:hypothetical protein
MRIGGGSKMSIFIKDSAVRATARDYKKQMSKTCMRMLDQKFGDYLIKVFTVHNGGKSRMTPEVLSLLGEIK